MTEVLFAEFTVKEGAEQEVARLVAGLTPLVRAEPGNVRFEPNVRREDSRRYFIYEVYRDRAAFDAHMAASHGVDFNSAIAGLIEEDGSALTWLESTN
ncbi:quinol monooxygenase YgiN [Conyzicola nivalis]|uniref:Quinol monooxygenase YgiN n=1 Tax=Conyzicola nivalis TaxID=1477021 RepID=A0ABV2QMH1_9MICO